MVFVRFWHKKKNPGLKAGDVLEDSFLALVHDRLGLSYGKVKFFCKTLVCYTVNQTPIHELTVSLCILTNYPFINSIDYICLANINWNLHF